MKTVLVTGFEPFGGDARNPSQEIAQALDGRVIAGARVAGAVLPCEFGTSLAALKRELKKAQPDVVLCLGLASGRAEITPERVAINVDDARIRDNAGRQPIDVPIVRGGPAAYWSRLPIKTIIAALQEKRVPATVSQTAGTFVCNHVFYGLMHALRAKPAVRGGFIHVPASPELAGADTPSLPLATMVDAIGLAIEVTLRTRRDRRAVGGRTH